MVVFDGAALQVCGRLFWLACLESHAVSDWIYIAVVAVLLPLLGYYGPKFFRRK